MVKIYGHPRSGNHYLAALLAHTLYPDLDLSTPRKGMYGHWSCRAPVPATSYGKLFAKGVHRHRHEVELEGRCVYIARSFRAVARSLYTTEGFRAVDDTRTFEEYLDDPIDWDGTPGRRVIPTETLYAHWDRHTQGWLVEPGAIFVQYDHLILDPMAQVRRIAQHDIPIVRTDVHTIGPVGFMKRRPDAKLPT